MGKIVCILGMMPILLYASEIPLVGINRDGSLFERRVTVEEYVSRMGALLSAAEVSTSKALAARSSKSYGSGAPRRKWRLRTFTLGIGLNFSIGVPKLLSFGMAPAFTLVFSNSKAPLIP